MAEIIKTIQLKQSDGTTKELTFAGLKYLEETDNGNLEIDAPYPHGDDSKVKGGKLNIEPRSNLAIKPADSVQLHTEKYVNQMKSTKGELSYLGNDADCSEFKINVINDNCDSSNCVEGLQINAAGLKFMTKDAHETDEAVASDNQYDADGNLFSPALSVYKGTWDDSKFPLQFKKNKNEWTKLNVHAKAIDLRTRALSAGTGGGIAVQIASCDDDGNENKFKIETSRIKDVFDGTVGFSKSDTNAQKQTKWEALYQGEGGTGIEIGTINSQIESFYTAEIRRAANSKVFATTRTFQPDVTAFYKALTEFKVRVLSRNSKNTWDSKDIEVGDTIAYVETPELSSYYKGKKCAPENLIMCFSGSAYKVSDTEGKTAGVDYIQLPVDSEGATDNYLPFAPNETILSAIDPTDYVTEGIIDDEEKKDYFTADDDSKDQTLNKSTSLYDSTKDDTVYWIDLINAALYLKRAGLIPNNRKLIGDPDATTATV